MFQINNLNIYSTFYTHSTYTLPRKYNPFKCFKNIKVVLMWLHDICLKWSFSTMTPLSFTSRKMYVLVPWRSFNLCEVCRMFNRKFEACEKKKMFILCFLLCCDIDWWSVWKYKPFTQVIDWKYIHSKINEVHH